MTTPLQKLLPRDPIDEILRTTSESHLRTLLRSLCDSSPEIKSKTQHLHTTILSRPPPPPPKGINLDDGTWIVIPNKYHPRKKKLWGTPTTPTVSTAVGGGSCSYNQTGLKRRFKFNRAEMDPYYKPSPPYSRNDIKDPPGMEERLPITHPINERNGKLNLPSLSETMGVSGEYSLELPPMLCLNGRDEVGVTREDVVKLDGGEVRSATGDGEVVYVG
ncbi:hypothetical protein TWF481_006139 [Arthrobotrys musiformis]|uniref:Uncharacterized protein n=1 Tax=Arthrobotrys musiformis TaxID=47236 RepID=A0AAV9WFW2_9PEZI